LGLEGWKREVRRGPTGREKRIGALSRDFILIT
jgi:hypothetical protein